MQFAAAVVLPGARRIIARPDLFRRSHQRLDPPEDEHVAAHPREDEDARGDPGQHEQVPDEGGIGAGVGLGDRDSDRHTDGIIRARASDPARRVEPQNTVPAAENEGAIAQRPMVAGARGHNCC